MKKHIKSILILLVILGATLLLLTGCGKKETITAGYYLDKITETRQEKQLLLKQIAELDKQIELYRQSMDKLQYSGLEYLGFTEEAESQQKTQ